eukprot:TRINITY_DN109072_c0_g1_i1.p1 TRINITY_DN109072_c0_g1~~TRINITY_DN109072_c0_g1_i1.p1  ORF type:complete len:259 (+),score=51.51 TRINITY_DN109072_c0_g1_i1:33-809(+)
MRSIRPIFSECRSWRFRKMSTYQDPDPKFPGTAVQRLKSIHARVATLIDADSSSHPKYSSKLSVDWEEARKLLLWAGGLKDNPDARKVPPGAGYTGHAFNDDNHCDLCCMVDSTQDETNADGRAGGDGSRGSISRQNLLGPGIRNASLQSSDEKESADSPLRLGPGGSWSTCTNGCHQEVDGVPQDVAHVQFQSRVAFKLVWVPGADGSFKKFVLVDDEGELLAVAQPGEPLPGMRARKGNFQLAAGSKYGAVAEQLE